MTDLNIGAATTTDLTSGVPDFSVETAQPDQPSDQKENRWNFSNAATDYGYFKTVPQYNAVTKALATYTVALGFETDPRTKVILDGITGNGKEGFQDILFNLECMKKAQGDAMAEIVRNDEGTLINLKPLWLGNMTVVYDEKGIIDYYVDNRFPSNNIKPENIFHITNDRMNNEMHGNPSSGALKWIIEAKEESLRDYRKYIHRSTIRVLYIDVDDTAKLTTVKEQYKEGIKNGEILILPVAKGEAGFEDQNVPPIDAFLRYWQYLDNLFYQTSGVPKIIATSEDTTESGGKTGFLTFQPFYTKEQVDMESALWSQLAIKGKFVKPPQLGGILGEDEKKDVGQTGFQPADTQANITRSE